MAAWAKLMGKRFDAAFWRDRAEETRLVADQLTDKDATRILMEIAENYERMARLAEKRR